MNSRGRLDEPSIENVLASMERFMSESAPVPNDLSAAYAHPTLNMLNLEARRDRDDAYGYLELLGSLHSLPDQLPPQVGASNLNGHRVIAGNAPSVPNRPSVAYAPPPPKTEARSGHVDAFNNPARLQPLQSFPEQPAPQIGASHLNGHRITAAGAPSAPNRPSAAYAPPPPMMEAHIDRNDAFNNPARFQSLQSFPQQLAPQIGAPNLSGPRISAGNAASAPNRPTAAYAPPPPMMEARIDRDDPFNNPARLQSLELFPDQLAPQIGAPNLNGPRISAGSAPPAPYGPSAAYAPASPKTEARSNREETQGFPELLRSIHSLTDQLAAQMGASNPNGQRIIAEAAPSTSNEHSATFAPPPPKTEARIDRDDAQGFPELLKSLHLLADQISKQIGASNLNGQRIDLQQRPERNSNESREIPLDRRRSNGEQASYGRAPDGASGLSALPMRTTEIGSSDGSSQAGGDGLEGSVTSSAPSPVSSQSADIPRQSTEGRDTLVVGPTEQSRTVVQPGIPVDDVHPPRVLGDSFGGPIIGAELRAREAEASASQRRVAQEPQGRTETASSRAIPEGLVEKPRVESQRPLLREWLDRNKSAALDRARHADAEAVKSRQ